MLPAIAVFAKAPIPGHVKTRLAVALGDKEAAKQYEQMVAALLQRLVEATECLGTDIELHTDMDSDAWKTHGVTRRLQTGGDLGARMYHALLAGLDAGRPRMMILGGDVPTVPIPHLQALLAADADVAIGPAEDGGYYAISCRAVHPDMFNGVAWSSKRAREQTIAACRDAGLQVFLGPVWFDIDEPSDLERIGKKEWPMALQIGSKAPELHLTDESGNPVSLSSFLGKTVVLYFYPRADTPGCTTESCEFRDHSAAFADKNTVIIGISPDTEAAQTKFKNKFDLPFTLLADASHAGAEAYGVWQEKSSYGKTSMGVVRTTFVIGPDGNIKAIFEKVKPAGHAEEVLAVL